MSATGISSATQALEACHTVVVKIGSSLLVDDTSNHFNRRWFDTLIEDLAGLKEKNKNIIVVSSGAIALGCIQQGLDRSRLRLDDIQAAAAVGQILLAHEFSDALRSRQIATAQILLTLDDTEERKRYLNARNTLTALLKRQVIPVINENDTVGTSEIRFGDNDRLAARVAQMISADCLVLLSDTDGLYEQDPRVNPDAELLEKVVQITPEIEAMAGSSRTAHGTGGMTTKVTAAKLAVSSGCHTVLSGGHYDHPLQRILQGSRCTYFQSQVSPVAKRKQWIAGSLKTKGRLTVDDGAAAALQKGSSLLPVGVILVEQQFERGDAVSVMDSAGREIARGLTAYNSDEIKVIVGMNSAAIDKALGYPGSDEVIHRDNLVLV